MKRSIRIITTTLIAVLMTACLSGCGSSEQGIIKFGTNAEFPPFEFVAANGVIGEFDGIDMAIAKKIGKDIGLTPVIENMEFDSLLVALQNKQIDAVIAGMTVTEERAESVDFSTPYYSATQVIITKEGSGIKSAADLANKFTSVVQGYTGETCIVDLGYRYESFKKGTECVMELVNGKCDAVVIDSATASKYVADNKGLVIVEDPEVFGNEEYAIAVAKGNKELLDKINASIEKMLSNGTIATLGDKYCSAE
ncbi:MAG: transporter substrate-binding domain-containing protein [Lachnospiraceae bacterium]|nr:transporter substrate-binding domain-containing protein [Lachnospiraceae bacterium]